MNTWIALLRAVNVGGRRMKMADLRALCAKIGLERPETHLQSGNLVFNAEERDREPLTARIEAFIYYTARVRGDALARGPFRRRLDVEDSALYQALYRLELRGLCEASWGVTDNNRRARYYAITEAGAAHLESEAERLTEYAVLLATMLAMDADAVA